MNTASPAWPSASAATASSASSTTATPRARRAVSSDTLFELGSISKTFTVTLAAYAQATGRLSLTDSPAKWVPELQGSEFAKLTLVNLATHTAGGFPRRCRTRCRPWRS
ncbi:serine hydrolase [Achromobacter insuavis]